MTSTRGQAEAEAEGESKTMPFGQYFDLGNIWLKSKKKIFEINQSQIHRYKETDRKYNPSLGTIYY